MTYEGFFKQTFLSWTPIVIGVTDRPWFSPGPSFPWKRESTIKNPFYRNSPPIENSFYKKTPLLTNGVFKQAFLLWTPIVIGVTDRPWFSPGPSFPWKRESTIKNPFYRFYRKKNSIEIPPIKKTPSLWLTRGFSNRLFVVDSDCHRSDGSPLVFTRTVIPVKTGIHYKKSLL